MPLEMVGMAGFEPATTCPPGKCATRLRYTPNQDFHLPRTGGGYGNRRIERDKDLIGIQQL